MVSKEQRAKWKSSVTGLLADSFGRQAFIDFLERRKGETETINCIEFWEKCELHKEISDVKDLKDSAKKIHETYLDRLAEKEIPAKGESRKIDEKLEKEDLTIEILKHIFDDAQENICKFISDGGAYK
ncbi:unnamed protein product, partial [Meganyctiphanes norvegica]